jgi:hypothetical protein
VQFGVNCLVHRESPGVRVPLLPVMSARNRCLARQLAAPELAHRAVGHDALARNVQFTPGFMDAIADWFISTWFPIVAQVAFCLGARSSAVSEGRGR